MTVDRNSTAGLILAAPVVPPLDWHPKEKVWRSTLVYLESNVMFPPPLFFWMARTAGIRAARKLKDQYRINRWADKRYNKSHCLASIKADALQGACQASGIVTNKIGVSAKQPNSAVRKAVRV